MKTAISLPDELFEAGEEAAHHLGVSRSQLYADALRAYLQRRSQHWIREALDRVYATESSELDPAITAAQAALLDEEDW